MVVSFHAHPDDEALLTAGTLAQAVADGHRVVLVVATAGESGLAAARAGDRSLGERRLAELQAAADVIGCHRVVLLGYGDSGMDGWAQPDLPAFATADVEEAAQRLATVLREERADALTVYDPVGGYGHPDHVQVHRVGVRAAELVGTPVVLEATVDRRLMQWLARLLHLLRPVLRGLYVPDMSAAFTDPALITHRVDVRGTAEVKRSALAAHASQTGAPTGTRTLALLVRLPLPVFRWALRYEWYVERGRLPAARPSGDVFETLRRAERA